MMGGWALRVHVCISIPRGSGMGPTLQEHQVWQAAALLAGHDLARKDLDVTLNLQ